ncbi:MAG: PSD1 and planctomycete cytochrome C domain-containing protein [Phycisphaeraceae bacterium]
MKHPTIPFFVLIALTFMSSDLFAADREAVKVIDANEQAQKLFVTQIKPLLAAKCMACHGDDPAKIKGKFDLRSRDGVMKGGESGEPSVVPGEPEKSPLYIAVTWKNEDLQMPPKENDRLSKEQIELVRQWIATGAVWSDVSPNKWKTTGGEVIQVKTAGGMSAAWTNREYKREDVWAYLPRQQVEPPYDALPKGAVKHPIDAFLQPRMIEAKVTPADRADDLTLIRRMTFDLTGLPPTAEEVAAFKLDSIRNQQSEIRNLLDRLLASPHYGERMAQHWLDVVRYADTSGFSNDHERPHAWRYRDYVIRSFNSDKPYDRFIMEQVAGDEIDAKDPEMLIAVGFLRMGPWEQTAMSVAAITRQMWLDDVTNTVGTTFLGQNMTCFRCHDHKFDPLPARDYYSMQAVFGSTQFAQRDAPFVQGEDQSRFAGLKARMEKWRDTDTLTLRSKLAANDNSFDRIGKKRGEHLKLAMQRTDAKAFSVETKGNQNVHILNGGALESPLNVVEPGVMSALGDFLPKDWKMPLGPQGRRLALAQWIAHKDNPLTARVIVNRVWQMHFGTGLVATPSQFGKMGRRPTHPELLDWLATWFVDNGWSIKKLHTLIMTSAAYQRSGSHGEIAKLSTVDPSNEMLAVFPPRRLTAEELRDAMLAATGELSQERGGPGVYPEINWEVALQPRHVMGGIAPSYTPSPTPAERNRRTIYAFRHRTLSDPMLEVFNKPGSEMSCERRDDTTVTPQVFALFNGQFVHDRATALALRVEKAGGSLNAMIEELYRVLFGRKPSKEELDACAEHFSAMVAHHRLHEIKKRDLPTIVRRQMVGEQSGVLFEWDEKLDMDGYQRDRQPWEVPTTTRALAEVCLVLLNSSEFVYVY